MRHNKKFNHLGRKASHRKAMLSNMAISLIEHKRITTTLQKAKELRKFVEPLINKTKINNSEGSKDAATSDFNARRVVFSYLQSKKAVIELFGTIAPKVADRPGGYTRIIKLGKRYGDAADMAFIELVDFDENMAKETKKKRTRRSSKKSSAAKAEATAEKKQETKPEETAPEAEEAKAETPKTDEAAE